MLAAIYLATAYYINMKIVSFLCVVALSVSSISPAKGQTKLGLENNLELFIEGHRYETFFNVDVFKKGFKLKISDTTYRFKQYHLNWTSSDGSINEVVLHDSAINSRGKEYSFNTAEEYFFIDNIIIEKGNVLYQTPALKFQLVDSVKYKSIYDTLAKNKAYIKEHSVEGYLVSSSVFSDYFTIGLRDNSYIIISFDVLFSSLKDDSELLFHFIGDKFSPSSEDLKFAIQKLSVNDQVFITNIKAKKDNKLYTIPELALIIRSM